MDRGHLEAAIAAQEGLRGTVPDEVVDTAIAALRQAASVRDTQHRRLVTVLFADLRGYTSMSETLDAEELSELMNAVWERLDAVVVEHGGHIDKHIGDALMAVWGVGATREDDAERAVRAGLGLQEALAGFRRERGTPLEMRVGINTGHVLLGSVGTTGEFTALGDAVNLASRLEHEAPIHGVLLSHDTYRHVRGVFETVARPPVSVRGKVEPVRTYLAAAVKPRAFRSPARGVEGVETTMVGRDRERAVLEQAFVGSVEDRAATWIEVSGEAGVGKSRLLWEFENWLELRPETIYFLAARATPQRQSVPLGLLRDLMASRLEMADTDPPETVFEKLVRGTQDVLEPVDALTLGRWLGFDLDRTHPVAVVAGEPLAGLGRAHLERFVRSLARRGPTVMLLEDLHWADPASLGALASLRRTVTEGSLVVVSSTRETRSLAPLDDAPGPTVRIELQPLNDDEVESLLRDMLVHAGHVPDSLVRALTARAEGNAFYLEEIVKMLIDRGSIETGDDVWMVASDAAELVDVPATLTGVLQARFDALPGAARHGLPLAAIIGRTFWDTAVEHLSAPTVPQLAQALDRELIFTRPNSRFAGSTEYMFKHALLYDVVRETVLLRDRPSLHERAADWLEHVTGERRDEFLVEIAEHLQLAGEAERAAGAFQRAARLALSAGTPAAAAQLGSRANALFDDIGCEVPTELLISMSHAYRSVGDIDGADQAARRAVARARQGSTPAALVEAFDAAVQALVLLGDLEGADALLDEATDVAERVGGDVLGRILIQRAVADLRAGRETRRLGQRILELAERSDDNQFVARAHIVASRIADGNRDYSGSDDHLRAALEISRETGDRWSEVVVLNNTGASLQQRGTDNGSADDLVRADAVFRQAIALCTELELREMLTTNTMNLAEVRIQLGDSSQARDLLRSAIAEAAEAGVTPLLLFGVIVHAQLLLQVGHAESARRVVEILERHPSCELVGDELDRLRQRLPGAERSDFAAALDEPVIPAFEGIVASIINGTELSR